MAQTRKDGFHSIFGISGLGQGISVFVFVFVSVTKKDGQRINRVVKERRKKRTAEPDL